MTEAPKPEHEPEVRAKHAARHDIIPLSSRVSEFADSQGFEDITTILAVGLAATRMIRRSLTTPATRLAAFSVLSELMVGALNDPSIEPLP